MLNQEPARPYEVRAQPSKTLLQRLYRDVSALAMNEIELAKVEMHDRGGIALEALRGFGLSAIFALVGAASVAACAIAALALVVALWLAALIVGAVALAIAFAAARMSQARLAGITEPLRSTIGYLIGPPNGKLTMDELRSRAEIDRRRIDETLSALEQKTDLVTPMRDTALGLGSLGVAIGAIVRNQEERHT